MLPWTPRATFPQLEGAVRSSSMARVAHVAHAGTPQHSHLSNRSSVTGAVLLLKLPAYF